MNVNLITLQPCKTYATEANAIKAVEKKYGGTERAMIPFFIHTHTDGRFFPVFIGNRAVDARVFMDFNVVA